MQCLPRRVLNREVWAGALSRSLCRFNNNNNNNNFIYIALKSNNCPKRYSYVINTMIHTFHQRLYKWVPANCWVNVVRIFTRNCYQVFTSLYSAGGDFVWEIEVILRVPVLPYASFSREKQYLLRESLAEHRHCFPY